ncbi:hypothetical protein LguiB_006557 [Lonicera macranthoides]
MKNKVSQASQHRRTPAPEEPNSGQTLSRRAAAPFYGHHNQHQKPVRLAMLCIAFSLFPLPWGSQIDQIPKSRTPICILSPNS